MSLKSLDGLLLHICQSVPSLVNLGLGGFLIQVKCSDFKKSVSFPQNYIMGSSFLLLCSTSPSHVFATGKSWLEKFGVGHLFPLGCWCCKQLLTLGSNCGKWPSKTPCAWWEVKVKEFSNTVFSYGLGSWEREWRSCCVVCSLLAASFLPASFRLQIPNAPVCRL